MRTEVVSADHPVAFQRAFDILKNGGLVAFPTDTVYGLASLAFDAKTIERIFSIKGRHVSKAIAVLISDLKELIQVASNVNKMAFSFAKHFWPGPLTLVLNRHQALPDAIAPFPTVGVRVPDHPVALDLLRLTGPLAVTSANLSGKENAITAAGVRNQLGNRIHLILDGGQTPGGIPSTVVDCTSSHPVILRKGPITLEQLQEFTQ